MMQGAVFQFIWWNLCEAGRWFGKMYFYVDGGHNAHLKPKRGFTLFGIVRWGSWHKSIIFFLLALLWIMLCAYHVNQFNVTSTIRPIRHEKNVSKVKRLVYLNQQTSSKCCLRLWWLWTIIIVRYNKKSFITTRYIFKAAMLRFPWFGSYHSRSWHRSK